MVWGNTMICGNTMIWGNRNCTETPNSGDPQCQADQ